MSYWVSAAFALGASRGEAKAHGRIAGRMIFEGDEHRGPVDDVRRFPKPDGEPPVPGAQWDEVHGWWQRWDDEAQAWAVIGVHRDDIDLRDEQLEIARRRYYQAAGLDPIGTEVVDLTDEPTPAADALVHAPAPTDGPPGAQWNEVHARWERWDPVIDAWVEA